MAKLDDTQKALVLAGVQTLQGEAVAACWDRYSFWGNAAGCVTAIVGGPILTVFIPGFGPWIAIFAGVFIAGSVNGMAGREGDAIESGDVGTITRYLEADQQERILLPFMQKAGLAPKEGENGKKTSPTMGQATSQNQNPQTFNNGVTNSKTTSPQKDQDAPKPDSGFPREDSGNGTSTSKGGLLINSPDHRPSWPDKTHVFCVGLSQASKTTVMQYMTQNLTVPIIYLTLKTEDTAPPGWKAFRLDVLDEIKLLRQLDWLISQWTAWIKSGVKHRLIIDEFITMKEVAHDACKLIDKKDEDFGYLKGVGAKFEKLVKLYIRAGASDGYCVGLLSQDCNGTAHFKSAKTQQGLNILLCASDRSSAKFRHFVTWAQQLFTDLLTPEVTEILKKIDTGFWHLFADGRQLILNNTIKPPEEMVKCALCPTSGRLQVEVTKSKKPVSTTSPLTDDVEAKTKQSSSQQSEAVYLSQKITPRQATQEVIRRIKICLEGSEAKELRQISKACRRKQDDYPVSMDVIRRILDHLIDNRLIRAEKQDEKTLYSLTGTSET